MSHYIKTSDISDRFINRPGTKLIEYLDRADAHMNRLAETHGVTDSDDISTDDDGYITDHTVKRYLACYVMYQYCMDHYGSSGAGDVASDFYRDKMEIYKKQCDELRSEITKEIITGEVDEAGDTSINTGFIYRS